MREIRVSSTLTVYHDGQFWVGMFECIENGKLSACRVVFGAEPSAEEIQVLICDTWNHLKFTGTTCTVSTPRMVTNPKRRQREAARELQKRGASTKSQQALSEEREAAGRERKTSARKHREQLKQRRFEMRQEKRKQKHRGR